MSSLSSIAVHAAATPQEERAYDLCVAKIRRTISRLADEPRSLALADDGNYFTWPEGFFEIGNWTSSFFTGMALLAFRSTRDPYYLQQVSRLADHYRAKVHEHAMDTMHDLGFLYSLYSIALHKLTGERTQRDVALRAAGVLADRFVPNGRYIRAWGRTDELNTDYAGLAIIDCMMNLPLLFWASQASGDPRFRAIAIQHADTTLRCLVRADDSVCHAHRFDLATGDPTVEANYCGRAVGSHWARGTAWAFYGFAMAYRYTREARYLDASERIARKFIASLDDQTVPPWDFRLPAGEPRLRDASAAAIAICGLQEMQRLGASDPAYAATAGRLLKSLCSEHYLDFNLDCPGILRHAQVGSGVGLARNAYTSWGDYYLMEALSNALHLGETFW